MNFEQHIRYSCSAYSMIHPNRAAVLNHLFCVNGNGYEWENGALVEVCGDTHYKNGKPMSMNAAIKNVFRKRRERNAATRAHERKLKRDMKLHPEKYPSMRDDKLDKLIEQAMEAARKAKEADPVGYAEKVKKQVEEFKASTERWKAEQKWEYSIPTDIDKRVKDTEFHHWYPMHMDGLEYAPLASFPDDIQDEWLDGIIETAVLICNSYERFERSEIEPFTKYPVHNDPDGKFSKQATRNTYAVANYALHRANEMKLARQNKK